MKRCASLILRRVVGDYYPRYVVFVFSTADLDSDKEGNRSKGDEMWSAKRQLELNTREQ